VEHGENDVVQVSERTPLSIFVAQFDSVLIWVLVAAAALSLWAGHSIDAILIAVIVVANGVFGFVQDYRAEQSLEALRELTAPTATVRRDGTTAEIAATELVPGDVLELESGDVVPADARVLEETDLEVDEAALTGESVPVSKARDPVDPDTPLAEHSSMVYKGTNVTRGKGAAVVSSTGMDTEVGAISRPRRRPERRYNRSSTGSAGASASAYSYWLRSLSRSSSSVTRRSSRLGSPPSRLPSPPFRRGFRPS
jgi:Ca2+-transporting ATPase